ncbi:MAG: glycosyltransferase family 1 protein [Candidatus Falkowbacteria bacterium]
MKIVIDARVLMDKRRSGVGEYVYQLVSHLLANDQANEYWLFYNSAKELAHLPEFPRAQKIKTNIPNKLLNYALFKLLGRPHLEKLLGFKPDIFLMPHLNFVACGDGYHKILTVHDLSFLQYPEFFCQRQNIWHRAIDVKKLVKRFDHIVAISQATKADLLAHCDLDESKVSVIHSGVSPEFRPIESGEELLDARERLHLPARFILFLGTLEPRKNIETLIAAYDIMRREHADLAQIKLVIAGSPGWKYQQLYAQSDASEYSADIIWKGYVDPADKIYYYNLASVFAFPSFYEGFGFPPLEAAACGTPVVASFASSLPEVVGESAWLIDPYDARSLADGLAQMLKNPELASAYVRKGLAAAKNFNWNKTAEAYLALFKSLS